MIAISICSVPFLIELLIFHSESPSTKQADHLRQQTLQQVSRILTTHQTARGLLALGEYFHRLRALSSLWAARPREHE